MCLRICLGFLRKKALGVVFSKCYKLVRIPKFIAYLFIYLYFIILENYSLKYPLISGIRYKYLFEAHISCHCQKYYHTFVNKFFFLQTSVKDDIALMH
jgi:hypothetical protein